MDVHLAMDARDVGASRVEGDDLALGDGSGTLPLGKKEQYLGLAFREAELFRGLGAAIGGLLVLESLGAELLLKAPYKPRASVVADPERPSC